MKELVVLVIGILATWRLTALLHYEDGPKGIFEKLRQRVRAFEEKDGKPVTFLGGLISCFWCLSVWVAMGLSIVSIVLDITAKDNLLLRVVLYTLAYSAGAIIVDEVRK